MIRNICAALGIVLTIFGLLCMPFIVNPYERPFAISPGFPGGDWSVFAFAGAFLKPGTVLLLAGPALLIIAKLLPKKH